MELKVGIICDRGLNPRRTVNQDRYLALVERGLFAVFDGVGGQRAGEVASQTAAETIEEALAHTSADSPSELIRRAIEFANRDIYEMAESDPAFKTMATTVALIHFDKDRATIAHVGDSRVYRLEDGRFDCETVDHTDLNDDLRAGRITKDEAAGYEDRNVINRALGVEPEVEVEVKTVRVREGARFLLCSDGIYKHLSDAEIARLLARHQDPQRAAEELKRIVYERGADDNLTAVVVQAGRARKAVAAEKIEVRGAEASAGVSHSSKPYETAMARRRQARAGGGRIQVEFAAAAASDVADQSGATEERTASRTVMYMLIGLVLLAGSFYAGLRASDWVNNSASDVPAEIDLMKTGRAAFEEGNYQSAALDFDMHLKREPQNARTHYWLGRAQLELGQYTKAAESFEQAIAIEPTLYDAYVQAAAAHGADGKREKADRWLRLYGEERRKTQR